MFSLEEPELMCFKEDTALEQQYCIPTFPKHKLPSSEKLELQ